MTWRWRKRSQLKPWCFLYFIYNGWSIILWNIIWLFLGVNLRFHFRSRRVFLRPLFRSSHLPKSFYSCGWNQGCYQRIGSCPILCCMSSWRRLRRLQGGRDALKARRNSAWRQVRGHRHILYCLVSLVHRACSCIGFMARTVRFFFFSN